MSSYALGFLNDDSSLRLGGWVFVGALQPCRWPWQPASMADSEDLRGPALSLASQTALRLRIDSIHMSIEAEAEVGYSTCGEEKLKSRLTSLTLPGGLQGKDNTLTDRYGPRLSLCTEIQSVAQSSKVIMSLSNHFMFPLGKFCAGTG